MRSESLTRRPLMRARWAALVAVGGGLAGYLAFPTPGIWPLAFVSVAGLSVAVDGRRSRTGAWLGLLYGAALFVPLLHWTGVYVGPAPWLILAVAEAGFLAGLGAVLPVVQRLRGAPLWIGCAWVLQEAARDRLPFGGFPWGRLAFSQAASPLRWFAAVGGAPLVTFAVAVGGGALGIAALRFSRPSVGRSSFRAFAALLAVAVAVPVTGLLLATALKPGHGAANRTVTVALIQGSVPERGLAFEDRARQVLDNHVAQTLKLARQVKAGSQPQPDLVLWPEDSSDVDPFEDGVAASRIDAAAKAIGAPILVGAILNRPDPTHRENAGILWSPTSGPGQMYLKRHPVPFGEYIPLRNIAKMVSSDVNLVTQDMVGGKGDGLLTGGPFPLGDVICFEVAYDSLVRSSVRAGAQMLVVQTNNATFGHTAETYQQLAMSRLRAVETGRTVAQVATTGISAVVGPDGAVQAQSGALFTPAIVVSRITLRTGTTLAVRLGAVPELVLAAMAVVALGWALRPARRRQAVPAAVTDEEMVRT
jgi:apolipoprotein N-acyltransferase